MNLVERVLEQLTYFQKIRNEYENGEDNLDSMKQTSNESIVLFFCSMVPSLGCLCPIGNKIYIK